MPLFQTSGVPLEEGNNYFPSQYLKGKTTLDLAVPYGPNFLFVPIHPANSWNSARALRACSEKPSQTAGWNESTGMRTRTRISNQLPGQWRGHSGEGETRRRGRPRAEGQKDRGQGQAQMESD